MAATETPIHHSIGLTAGQLLQVEIDKLKISQIQLAIALGVTRQTVSAVINGHLRISKGLSKKLGTYFGNPPEHWRELSLNQEIAAIASERGLAGQSLMADIDIEEAIETKEIALTGFDPDRLRQASYDFTYGALVFDLTTGDAVAVGAEGITIQPGQTVNMSTVEHVHLKDSFAGIIGGTSELARFGLIVGHGLQADPGYNGPLQFSVFNSTGKPIPIRRDAAIISMVICKLSRKPKRPFTQTQRSQEDTRARHIARQQRGQIAIQLEDFVREVAQITEQNDGWSAGLKDLPMSHVIEPSEDLAVAHVSKFLASLLHKGWCRSTYDEKEQTRARDQLSVMAVSRSQMIALYEAFDVDVTESEDLISADWFEGSRPAGLCTSEGRKNICPILDEMEIEACFAKLFDH